MASIPLIAGETLHPVFKGLVMDKTSAAGIKEYVNQGPAELAELVRLVDSRLPKMMGDQNGLHILNPNTMPIVQELLVNARAEHANADDGSRSMYHVTREVMEEAAESFPWALEAQMANGRGPIFAAVRLTQTLFCDLRDTQNMSCAGAPQPVMGSQIFQENAARIINQYVRAMHAIPEPQDTRFGDVDEAAVDAAYQSASHQLTALSGTATMIGDEYAVRMLQRAREVLDHRRSQYEHYVPSWAFQAKITACVALTLCWGGGREANTLARQSMRFVSANMLSPELADPAE